MYRMDKAAAVGISFSVCLMLATATSLADEKPAGGDKDAQPGYTTKSLQGRVVFMADALQRLHGVSTVPEAKERIIALETPEGKLCPLVEDKRGRSFRLDERLMGTPMELLVRQHEGSPAIQVIRIHTLEDGKKYLVDYWCDICAITMFELKPCDCCQGPIRLRKREVTDDGEVLPEAAPSESDNE